MPSSARLRSLWWTAHRWVALALMALLIPVCLSGSLLVWHDRFDALLNPARYAVSGPRTEQPAAAYLARAAEALPPGFTVVALRFPDEPGWPLTVTGRGTPAAEGGPTRLVRVYLDPPSGRVLDVVDVGTSFIGALHRFHASLAIPGFFGRHIVGWLGTGMLILSLSGIWLWWPRSGTVVTGLRWRRAPKTITNLHFLFGLWLAIPLAVVSFTGMYLAFPQTARGLMSAIVPMNPQASRPGFAGQVVHDPMLTADAALARAVEREPGARAAGIVLPATAGARGRPDEPRRDGEAGGGSSPAWRIQLRTAGDAVVTVIVDDRTGALRRAADPFAGDRAAQWMRWIHEGSHSGPAWQILVFLTGPCAAVLGLTGFIMWLRGRRNRQSVGGRLTVGLAPRQTL